MNPYIAESSIGSAVGRVTLSRQLKQVPLTVLLELSVLGTEFVAVPVELVLFKS